MREVSYSPSGCSRYVTLENAKDTFEEIKWCLENGGDFVYSAEKFVSNGRTGNWKGFFLRHQEYAHIVRPLKGTYVKELIKKNLLKENGGNNVMKWYIVNNEAKA